MFSDADIFWMQHAIHLAKTAAQQQEVPVGAVLVFDDTMVGEGFNCSISACDPSAHAEVVALRNSAKLMGNYRLMGSTLYVTLEPCIMCVGALVQARVKHVIFGASDPKAGAVHSVFQMAQDTQLNHRVEYQGGLLAEQCGNLLTEFFRSRR